MLYSKIKGIKYQNKEMTPGAIFSIIEYECLDSSKNNPLAVDENGNDLNGETFVAKGYNLPISTTFDYNLIGEWVVDRRGRRIFEVSYAEEYVESTKDGILNFLLSPLFTGIGMKTAHNLYKEFGNETLNVLRNHPERLTEVNGIGEAKKEQIIASYKRHTIANETISFLSKFNISVINSINAYNKYGIETIDVINRNIYDLYHVRGFDFPSIDAMASKLGYKVNSHERIATAVYEVLKLSEGKMISNKMLRVSNPGSSCIPYKELHPLVFDFLRKQVSVNEITSVIRNMLDDKRLEVSKIDLNGESTLMIYLKETAEKEHDIADFVVSHLSEVKLKYDIEDAISRVQVESGFKLDKTQSQAVRNALTNRLSVITGGPGTGKTTIINFIYKIFDNNNPNAKIGLCAPTGRAAKKMSESTGAKASTIHSFFNITPDIEGVEDMNDDKMIDEDIVIIDEASMIDIYVMSDLIKKIPEKTQVVIMGDVDQLPAIAAGSVLRDLIESEGVPVSRLKSTHRQDGGSLIPKNAFLINNGKINLGFGEDFRFYEASSLEESINTIDKIYRNYSKMIGISEIAILNPFRENGVDKINNIIQDKFNPLNGTVASFNTRFRKGDKVIQNRNNKEVDVANGDTGIISDVNTKPGNDYKLRVDFGDGKIVNYSSSDLFDLDLGYANTIHKSQGSEYDLVIINILDEHSVQLTRSMIYTAVTRAKERVILVGSKNAINKAIMTEGTKRISTIPNRIKYLKSKRA